MGALIGAFGVLLLVVGVFGIVRPSWFRLHRRRHAVALWSLSFVLIATGGALSPPPDGNADATPVEIWLFTMLAYALAFGTGWLICRAIDARRANPTVDRIATERSTFRRLGARSAERGRGGGGTTSVYQKPAPVTADADYLSKTFDPVASDEELAGEVNTRTPLRFEYVDSDGVVSVREIINWIDTRFYVKGICTSRHASRTFRKDRIERWLSGHDAMLHGVLPFGRSRF